MKNNIIDCVAVKKIKFIRLIENHRKSEPIHEFSSIMIYKRKNSKEYEYFWISQEELGLRIAEKTNFKIKMIDEKKHLADIIESSIEKSNLENLFVERITINLSANNEVFKQEDTNIIDFINNYMNKMQMQ